jgi:beta-glucosidase
MKKTWILSIAIFLCFFACEQKQDQSSQSQQNATPPDSLLGTFWDYSLPIEERLDLLIDTLSLEEKMSLMLYNSPAIERLGIPAYNWWNEALHGVARAGKATVFPQAIGLGATFDPNLINEVATAISDEGRAKYNAALSIDNRLQYMGVSYWSPNVNIFRDPRWGRGHETYGEDPFLSGTIGSAFVRGLQGDHPKYLKAAACAKHYAVHSGPEGLRHEFNAVPPRKDFAETYLPAFEMLVKNADVEAVMCAYNRTYGLPCCGSGLLLQDILRNRWGFNGHIVSDCWALVDFHENHKITATPEESAAMALKAGVNVNCGTVYQHLMDAFEQGMIDEEMIDRELRYLMRSRFKLGMFDPLEMNPYNDISLDVIGSDAHKEMARKAAQKSIVLLKNDGVLPLRKDLKDLQVLGVHGNDAQVMYGNYFGQSENAVTIMEGITRKVHPGTRMEFRQGVLLDRPNVNPIDWSASVTSTADAVIAVMGISNLLEGEEGESIASTLKGDRQEIQLPQNQIDYIKKLRLAGDKPLVLILTGGSPIDISEVEGLVDAILFVWYPGEQGGNAVADVLFGDVNPSGRLPITFPSSLDQLPPYEDYSMEGRTYKYMTETPLYPFGFGLSYTQFSYDKVELDGEATKDASIKTKVTVKNTGDKEGEEVVQLYLTDLESSIRMPRYSLVGFKSVMLKSGESTTLEFEVSPGHFYVIDENGEKIFEPGKFRLTAAGASPSDANNSLGAAEPVTLDFELD